MRVAVLFMGFLAASVALSDARAEPASPKPSLPNKPTATVIRLPTLVPSPLVRGAGGAVTVDDASLELLIALALRLASGDATADNDLLLQMMAELNHEKAALRALIAKCEAQRSQGKPCEHEADIATLRDAIAAGEREIEARRRQSVAERAARLASDLARIAEELQRVLGSLKGGSEIKPTAGAKTVAPSRRVELSSKAERAIDQLTAKQRALESAKSSAGDAGAR